MRGFISFKLTARTLVLAFGLTFGAQAIAQEILPTDLGGIKPADPKKFYKKAGYSPYAGRVTPSDPCGAMNTCTPAGRPMRECPAPR